MKSIKLLSLGYAFARGKEFTVLAKNEVPLNSCMHRNSRKVRKIVKNLNRMVNDLELNKEYESVDKLFMTHLGIK